MPTSTQEVGSYVAPGGIREGRCTSTGAGGSFQASYQQIESHQELFFGWSYLGSAKGIASPMGSPWLDKMGTSELSMTKHGRLDTSFEHSMVAPPDMVVSGEVHSNEAPLQFAKNRL